MKEQNNMKDFFADLHIHIGWTEKKEPVKISASKNLTFYNIIMEAYHHKGLDMIGIIDAHSPQVQKEILYYLDQGLITEQVGGGLKYKDLTIILGSEIELRESGRGEAHFLVYFPFLNDMLLFTKWLQPNMKNTQLSSQRLYVPTQVLQKEVLDRGGLFIPAHIFTPFKSVYGKCCEQMAEVLKVSMIDAVELGLSSDSEMADRIEELHNFTFVTNSDAHSLAKIGREYNKILMEKNTFSELALALKNKNGRKITGNYGLDPKLGKYHKSRCLVCDQVVQELNICEHCGSKKIIKGVSQRIDEIATYPKSIHPSNRPKYTHQIPLEFIPKLGPKTLEKLLMNFGTEMNILHKVAKEDLLEVIPENLADKIIKARQGQLSVKTGAGGIYGKVLK